MNFTPALAALLCTLSMTKNFSYAHEQGFLRHLTDEQPGVNVCHIPPGQQNNFRTQSIGGGTAIVGACNDNCDYVCPLVLDRPDVCNLYQSDSSCEEAGCSLSLCNFKLTAPDPSPYDYFGEHVAVEGNTLVIGTRGRAFIDSAADDEPSEDPSDQDDNILYRAGTVFVYKYDSMQGWTLHSQIWAPDVQSSHSFGSNVVLEGNVLLVAAHGDNDAGSRFGAMYVYERESEQDDFVYFAKLTSDESSYNESFGMSAAVNGNIIVIGGKGDPYYRHYGSVFVYEKVDGVWTFTQKLTSSDPKTLALFGNDVATDGESVFVGAPNEYFEESKKFSGVVYVYGKTDAGMWDVSSTLVGAEAQTGLGYSIALHESTMLVGAARSDSAHLFTKNDDGMWTHVWEVSGEESSGFGQQVALDDNLNFVVGAQGERREEPSVFSYAGSASIFKKTEVGWELESKFLPVDPAHYAYVGVGVGISGNHVVVGARNGEYQRAGSAYYYQMA